MRTTAEDTVELINGFVLFLHSHSIRHAVTLDLNVFFEWFFLYIFVWFHHVCLRHILL